jgi:hypothetical protein
MDAGMGIQNESNVFLPCDNMNNVIIALHWNSVIFNY